jgi:hypothetical protein
VIRREDIVIPMPVLPRWRDKIGEPVEELIFAACRPEVATLIASAEPEAVAKQLLAARQAKA